MPHAPPAASLQLVRSAKTGASSGDAKPGAKTPATRDLETRLARKLGNRSTLMMAGHGVVVTGPTVAQAFNDLYYLERAAMFQVLARSSGRPLRTISDAVREKTGQQMMEDVENLSTRHFAALRRMLDAQEPEYRH